MYTELRKKLLTKRNKISSIKQQSASKQITQKILSSKIFKQSKNIAFYLATAGEIDTWELITKALAAKKHCFLPVVEGKQLYFIHYLEGDLLYKNKWHILEPQHDQAKLIVPEKLDLVIVPLVGFNGNNFRLGMGKGYYDRTFAFKLIQPNCRPYLLGVAYSWQKVDFIPQSWDVPVQEIITNN